uniref:Uncharacterized protein n=1 Tax=Tanacetum cinerariifolium TaxID=118510 RepID=A0A6L2LTD7_TANCI|nr:hypothetical protein [Tanacetum cinerariifolium]
MEYVKNSIDKKALHKSKYDSRVNERQMQTTKKKVDTSKALDACLVNTESSGTKSRKQDTSSSLGKDIDADDEYIKPVYDEEPMAETFGLRWVPTRKILTSSTTKVDSKPTNGSNKDITDQYEYEQTLDVSAGTLNLSAELGIHDHSNEPSSSKLVSKVVPSAVLYTLRKRFYGYDLIPNNILVHDDSEVIRYKRRCYSLILAKSNSLPHAHAQTTKTYYKHQVSSIKKAQDLKTKTFANSDIQDLLLRYQVYQGRLLASFLDDAKYEHVGQDTRSQDGKDDQDKQGEDLKISESKMKSKDNDKGYRSMITQHEGTSLQHNKDQRLNN